MMMKREEPKEFIESQLEHFREIDVEPDRRLLATMSWLTGVICDAYMWRFALMSDFHTYQLVSDVTGNPWGMFLDQDVALAHAHHLLTEGLHVGRRSLHFTALSLHRDGVEFMSAADVQSAIDQKYGGKP